VAQDKVQDWIPLADEICQACGGARSVYDFPAGKKKIRCHSAQDHAEEEEEFEEDPSWVGKFALCVKADLPVECLENLRTS
jgi:LSD1 subclass zinc finger protein